MSIKDLIDAGVFDEPKKYVFKMDLVLKNDQILDMLQTNRRVRLASTTDFNVADLLLDKNNEVTLQNLPIHLRDTGRMANRSVENMIAYLRVDFTFNEDMFEVVEVTQPKKKWYQF